MRPSLLLWMVWLFTLAPTGAQPTSDALPVDDARMAQGLFRAIGLQFETGRSTLLPHAVPVLDAVAAVLDRYPSIGLEIAGHTDAVGSTSLNMRLSEERARAVEAYLTVRHGIESDRLETRGYGSSVPIASNDSPAGRALNRRVEFRIIDPGADRIPSAEATSERRPQIDADSIRAALQRQVEEAVRAALAESDPDSAEIDLLGEREQELEERLARIERELAADPLTPAQPPGVGPPDGETVPVRRVVSRFGILPFTGIYVRGDVPVLVGLRADVPTALFGSARFQPEAAVGFRPDDRAIVLSANLVFPVRLDSHSDVLPFFGAGIGFHSLDAFESVLNLLVGLEYRFDFGVLFGELMTQDFSDYNRVIIGFRQDL